jgi:hypothetical protein
MAAPDLPHQKARCTLYRERATDQRAGDIQISSINGIEHLQASVGIVILLCMLRKRTRTGLVLKEAFTLPPPTGSGLVGAEAGKRGA